MDAKPAPHGMHAAAPDWFWYECGRHSAHTTRPETSAYVPGAHSMH